MTDETEQMLSRVTPRGASDALRDRVLLAVEKEIGREAGSGPPWERWLGLLTAAALLLGVGMNVWAVRHSEDELARLSGPPPIPQSVLETAEVVEAVAGADAARWVRQRLIATRSTPVTRGDLHERQLLQQDRISRAMHELELTIMDPRNGKNWQIPEANGNHPGRANRRGLDHQRDPYFLGGRSA